MFQDRPKQQVCVPYDPLLSFDYRLSITTVQGPSAYRFWWDNNNEDYANLEGHTFSRSSELTTSAITLSTQCLGSQRGCWPV